MSDVQVDERAVTNRLLAALVTQEKTMPTGASLLADLGMSHKDIAAVYRTTEASIRSAVSRGRRGKGSDNAD